MTRTKQKQQIGDLALRREDLKCQIACLESKLTGWKKSFSNLSNVLAHAAAGKVRVGQKSPDENTFVITDRDHGRGLPQYDNKPIPYPDFDEINQTLLGLQQARLDLANVTKKLADCGVQLE